MAYQTGTATDADDLLAKLHSFALANGWTINNYVPGTSYDTVLQISSNSCFANIVSDNRVEGYYLYGGYFNGQPHKTIRMKPSTGFDGAKAWWDQPGNTGNRDMIMEHMIGPFPSYHLFGNSQYIHLVVERVSGEYDHLMIGEIDKTATFTGGAYGGLTFQDHRSQYIDDPWSIYHTWPWDSSGSTTAVERTAVYFPFDGKTWRYCVENAAVGDEIIGAFRFTGYWESLIINSPNEHNGLTPLFPIPIFAERPSNKFSPIGYVPDLRVLNIKAINPGDSIFLGPDEWVCFPVKVKKDPGTRDDRPNSGWYGYAFRKVV